MTNDNPNPNLDDYWPCACVRHPRGMASTQIKFNHKSVSRCRKCGATRDNAERFAEDFTRRNP